MSEAAVVVINPETEVVEVSMSAGSTYTHIAEDAAASAAASAASAAASAAAADASADAAAVSAAEAAASAVDAEASKDFIVGVADGIPLSVEYLGAVGDGVADDSAAFLLACASGKHVVANSTAYKLVGEFPMASGTHLEFTANPTISMNLSGENGRGFYFGPGVTNAGVFGSANINASATSLSAVDGARNGVFTFGSDYYVTSDPAAVRRCSVVGSFKVTCMGALNTKPVQMFGYVEDVLIQGVYATGQTNYAFVCHWIGNGSSGVLPTKTWHPHRIRFENCVAEDNATSNLVNGFVVSACGHVVFDNCHVINPSKTGFNPFVGDYGYTYAQNLNNSNAFNITLDNCSFEGSVCGLSVDAISSRVNSSPQWAGCDHNASVVANNFLAKIKSDATYLLDVAIAGLSTFTASNFRIIEEGSLNERNCLYLTSIGKVIVDGSLIAQSGPLIRDCGFVKYDLDFKQQTLDYTNNSAVVSASATSETTVITGAVSIGGTSIGLRASSIITGPGGIIKYNDGSNDHELQLEESTHTHNSVASLTFSNLGTGYADGTYALAFVGGTGDIVATGTYTIVGGSISISESSNGYALAHSGCYTVAPTVTFPSGGGTGIAATVNMNPMSGVQAVQISPSPVAIPDGATVTLIQTVKSLTIGPVNVYGTQYGVRLMGDATAKIRGARLLGTTFSGSGYCDIDADSVNGLVIDGTEHNDGCVGSVTPTDLSQVRIGVDTENFIVTNTHFGKRCTTGRYLIRCATGAKNGVISNNIFESYNASASNPAAISKASSVNVVIENNLYAATMPPVYPVNAPTIYTLDTSGVISIDSTPYYQTILLDTFASAATDDLVTINGGTEGQVIILATASSSRDVVVKDATGNLQLNIDCTLSNQQDTLTLIKRSTSWFEMARSDNAA
jgi:hypothetical protein